MSFELYRRQILTAILFFGSGLYGLYCFSATYTVTSTANSGAGTLRQAITDANASAGSDNITFNIAGAGPHTISLTSELPALTDNSGVTIDGFTQSGASANTVAVFNATSGSPMNAVYKIILTGLSGSASHFKGLSITSNNNIVKGLVFKSFAGTSTSLYYNNPAIYITGNSNSITGCYIGVAEDGATQGGNKTGIGVYIDGSAASTGQNNLIGDGTAAGANVISGLNTHECIRIAGSNATGNRVRGNMIGLQDNGTNIVSGSSQAQGVHIFSSSGGGNTIGGTSSGEGNVISGNPGGGIFINSSAVSGNTVVGNIIGPRADGLNAVSSNPQTRGIYLIDTPNNTIGGTSSGARNIISANEQYGVFYQGATTSGNNLKGNYIGINKNGNAVIPSHSQNYGIGSVVTAVGANTIGGSAANEGNVISGNLDIGVWLVYSGFTVYGNIIGLQADGASYLASNTQQYGMQIDAGSQTIGGASSTMRNIVSGNEFFGIYISNSASGVVIKGNYLGPGSGLGSVSGSGQDYGLYITTNAANNTIGGSLAGEPNVIAHNTADGVFIVTTSATGNKISRNPIYSNNSLGKPINLNYGASQGNNGKAAPVINVFTTSVISGTTSGAFDVIEVFKNSGGTAFDATTFIGSTVANGSGNWSLSVASVAGDRVMANATDGSNNTSEFSSGTWPLPVELVNFGFRCIDEEQLQLTWTTGTERNNADFFIERSDLKADDWEERGNVKGAGQSSVALNYEFVDKIAADFIAEKPEGWFYRLVQMDFDGYKKYFQPVFVSCKENSSGLNLFPNPANGQEVNVLMKSDRPQLMLLVISDIEGRETFHKLEVWMDAGHQLIALPSDISLRPGIYLIKASSEDGMMSRKLIVR